MSDEHLDELADRYFHGLPPVAASADTHDADILAEHIANVVPKLSRDQRARLAAQVLAEPPS